MTGVSVVVPVFNGLPYVVEAMDSILRQTRTPVQIVVVDGGSDRETADWVRGVAASGADVDFMTAGTSAAATWTRACERASEPYVKLLCQDDLLYPQALAYQSALLDRIPDAALAVSRRDVIDSRGSLLLRAVGCSGLPEGRVPGDVAVRRSYALGQNIIGEPLAVLFRRDALDGSLPWCDSWPFVLDLEMYSRVVRDRCIAVGHDVIGAFRISPASWSTRLGRQQLNDYLSWQSWIRSESDVRLGLWARVQGASMVRAKYVVRQGFYRHLRRSAAWR